MRRVLNIQGIVDLGENTERAFFSWLREQGIWWNLAGWNLSKIFILNTDSEKIKSRWKEVKIE